MGKEVLCAAPPCPWGPCFPALRHEERASHPLRLLQSAMLFLAPSPRDGKLMRVLPGGADGGIPAPVSGGKDRVKCPAVFPLAPQQIP